jgi:hypothetical protein
MKATQSEEPEMFHAGYRRNVGTISDMYAQPSLL